MSAQADDGVTASWSAPAGAWSILVHGGAGDVPADRVAAHVAGCEEAAAEGAAILARGGSALDAVQRAVEALEDDPCFNAGTGACLNADGHIELDAAIMDGRDLRAGGVGALPPFRNPITIARRVMDESRHALLVGAGAARFALAMGFLPAQPAAMRTSRSLERWQAARAKVGPEPWAGGTVGAVARDAGGHVAAATSTGGMINNLVGRVGDSPIPGAGTYADDEAGACSTTGHGEAMMRVCLAKTAVDALRAGQGAEAAARASVAMMLRRTALTGGLILIGRDGAVALARSTRTMTWASVVDGARASGA